MELNFAKTTTITGTIINGTKAASPPLIPRASIFKSDGTNVPDADNGASQRPDQITDPTYSAVA